MLIGHLGPAKIVELPFENFEGPVKGNAQWCKPCTMVRGGTQLVVRRADENRDEMMF
jgi:hypothetical protein